jgi:endoglucanase
MIDRVFLTIVAFWLIAVPAWTQESIASKRLRHLQHGINTSEWFAQSSDYSPARLRSFTTLEDIDRIARMGFDHIRISIDPAVFCYNFPWSTCAPVVVLDEVVARALSRNLAVIIDLHPNSAYKREIASSEASVERCAQLWAHIAEHFASLDPERVFFEVMNEPEAPDKYRWTGIQQYLMASIRRHAPQHTIIVAGSSYSNIEDLIALPEFIDRNVIFAFHYYSPHTFTHQGASWGAPYWIGLRDIPFPATGSTDKSPSASDEANWQLLQYQLNRWDPQRIAAEIKFAADWASHRGVPLLCDEFGVYRTFTKPEDRLRWLTAVRQSLEKNQIGWSMWDYRGGFGVVEVKDGVVTEDHPVLQALGLEKWR